MAPSLFQDLPSSIPEPPAVPEATLKGRPSVHTVDSSNAMGIPDSTTSDAFSPAQDSLLAIFLESHKQLSSYRNGDSKVTVDGHNLTIADVVAAACYHATVDVDRSSTVLDRMKQSFRIVDDKLEKNHSIYGLTTGFGGSADTRTNQHLQLGKALFQHQQGGVLPNEHRSSSDFLPLGDPFSTLSMPESWVRASILVRMNSLVRGHSGVSMNLVDAMATLMEKKITPLVPLRGSISASGDLSPLSYVAGTLIGNPAIRVWCSPNPNEEKRLMTCTEAYKLHGLDHHTFHPKEHLGLLNGTAFSAAVASLALHESLQLAVVTQVLTAMGTEALLGMQASHDPFIHETCRPHPGQVEAARNIHYLLEGSKLAVLGHKSDVAITEDAGVLRQDRYPLRTSPQFIGPQIEDILHALKSIELECNSTTDNPLIDGSTGIVHHGGNFQAMHVTNAMEKTRLALHHFGKILFAQSTELMNPATNRGLPPNLAATDPSLNYHCKGVDILTAAYVSELGYLANPVSTHIQSAEMHNQGINSLALISARATLNSVDVLSLLVSSYIYCCCQALDLRAMQMAFDEGLAELIRTEFANHFAGGELKAEHDIPISSITAAIKRAIAEASNMDHFPRMMQAAGAATNIIVDHVSSSGAESATSISSIPAFRMAVASKGSRLLESSRLRFLSGQMGAAPASQYLGHTRRLYEFVRLDLGIKMHGDENQSRWEEGFTQPSIGQQISKIHEALRDGRMRTVIASLFN